MSADISQLHKIILHYHFKQTTDEICSREKCQDIPVPDFLFCRKLLDGLHSDQKHML